MFNNLPVIRVVLWLVTIGLMCPGIDRPSSFFVNSLGHSAPVSWEITELWSVQWLNTRYMQRSYCVTWRQRWTESDPTPGELCEMNAHPMPIAKSHFTLSFISSLCCLVQLINKVVRLMVSADWKCFYSVFRWFNKTLCQVGKTTKTPWRLMISSCCLCLLGSWPYRKVPPSSPKISGWKQS